MYIKIPTLFIIFIFSKYAFNNPDYKEMQEFIDLALKGFLIDQNQTLSYSKKPLISIIIGIYNGEGYIKNGLFSIKNQDFKDIEIIFVDDFSKDNSTELIEGFMKDDPRIRLFKNEERRGTLFTKSKGVLNSRGKYVLIFDQDDMYTKRYALSTLYNEIEKNKLDILGFTSIETNDFHISSKVYMHKFRNNRETEIIYQPDIRKKMYIHTKTNLIIRKNAVIWNYLIKNELFVKCINSIDDKIMNTRMVRHEDYLLFFLLSRNAFNLKYINKVFYAQIILKKSKDKKIIFSMDEKNKNKKDLECMSFINYAEFLLIKTDDTIIDKKIASYELERWVLTRECKNNELIKERSKEVFNLFINNKYIENKIKKKLLCLMHNQNFINNNSK
jgi:glycosyltransferase involved in cell wall biosynthesis